MATRHSRLPSASIPATATPIPSACIAKAHANREAVMDLPAYQTLKTELGDRILVVTLNRPEAMNALNTQMGLDLGDLWGRLATCGDEVRVAILTAAGDRAFCAGGGFKERNGLSDEAWRPQH